MLKAPASAPIAPSVFMVYGPTRDNPAPHWTTLPLIVAGETIEVRLGDGDAGDDDLLINNVIVGVGGPAALGEVAIPGPGGSLVLLLSLALVGIPQRRLRPAHARRPAERQGRAPI